jgi:hypothetical protein
MPIGGVARQTRNFQANYDAGFAQAHLGHQFLESFPVHRRRPGLSQITIDDDDLLRGPAQSQGMLPESILTLGTLRVLEDLTDRRLPDIQVSVALEMVGSHLVMSIGSHGVTSSSRLRMIPARTLVICARTSSG